MNEPNPPSEHGADAVGWVLHTLEPEDEAAFLEHLADCAECRRTVARTSALFEEAARAMPALEPPPALRERIIATAEEEATAGVPGDAAAPSPRDAAPQPADAAVLPPGRRVLRPVLVAAAVVLLVAAVGGVVVSVRSLQDQGDARGAAAQRADAVVRALEQAGRPESRHASLVGQDGRLVGLVVDAGSGPRVLTTALGVNRGDQTYVLWGMGARPVPLGTFDVQNTAPTVRSVGSGALGKPYTGYAVSLESGRTAPASPTDVVATGQVGR